MTIQWFPGHMAKARREVTEKLKLVDIVFELIDARLPLSSRNPMIDEVIHQKPRLLILNKADLADDMETKKWLRYFEARGNRAIAINSFEGKGMQTITKAAKEILRTETSENAFKRNSTRSYSGNDCRYSERWEINTH